MNTIGERIKYIRKENNLKQEDFAKELSVSRSFISRIESNKEKASETVLKLISLQYNVSLQWLMYNKGEYKADKENDYFERGYEENFKADIIPLFSKLLSELESYNSASLYLAVGAIIADYTKLLKTYESMKNTGIVIFDQLNSNIISLINIIYVCENNFKDDTSKTNKSLEQAKKDFCEFIEELENNFNSRPKINNYAI